MSSAIGYSLDCSTADDLDLVDMARTGDSRAFEELYRRHHASACGFARSLLGSAQNADDIVAESFTKVFQRIVSGGGPTTAFRAYLLTTVRTTFCKQLASERMVNREVDLSELAVPVVDGDPVLDRLDVEYAATALTRLPERWRTVLVLLEVEGKSTAEVAALLEMQANAVAALAFRARKALRIAYAQMHVQVTANQTCRAHSGILAEWLCGRLNRNLRVRVRQHVGICAVCATAAHEVAEVLKTLGVDVCPSSDEP
ncbi:MAG TPA: sigma-70 family RNA polymerase sigma factor [Umezawaea sp.]|nr:sigma-70 family RNA polymerase sigma factor [Umezawaea sp.]